MLKMSFERRHKVLLATFWAELTQRDLELYDSEVARFLAMSSEAMRGILDFSGVGRINVTSEQVAGRAQQPQVNPGRPRVYVAPTLEMYGLCRMFAAYQDFQGFPEADIVRSLDEAYDLLGVVEPLFEAVEL